MNILVINCGSSSVKYQLLNSLKEALIAEGTTELTTEVSAAVAVQQALKDTQGETIDAVGHRVVHGGDTFRDAV